MVRAPGSVPSPSVGSWSRPGKRSRQRQTAIRAWSGESRVSGRVLANAGLALAMLWLVVTVVVVFVL